MTVVALWAPLEVADFDATTAFYGELLGLMRVDEWQRDGERGAVYAAGHSGRVELVQPAPAPLRAPASAPALALELPSWADVDDLHRRAVAVALTAPAVFPRGHYGFVLRDPDGTQLLAWSEARS